MELCLKPVGSIKGLFFVPSYQRGYRWREKEVKQLINDIYTDKNEKYCLQPIVVKQRLDGSFELIDGQQRLTTIYIILSYMKNESYKPKLEIKFDIEYELRKGSADYLRKITEEHSYDYIDYWYMYRAYSTIGEWVSEQPDGQAAVDVLYPKLVNQVEVIWYEVDENVEGMDLFERLNIGKIPLTNAELVKAMFIGGEKCESGKWLDEISYIWDMMERELGNEDMWYFIASSKTYQTRMDLVLEFVCDGKYPDDDEYGVFFELQEKALEYGYRSLWDDITATFNLLKDWYENNEYYHKIGYLVTTGVHVKGLVEKAMTMTKQAFMSEVDNQIRDCVSLTNKDEEYSELSYENKNEYKKIYNVLLLFNVLSSMKADSGTHRFSFALYRTKKWSLEHIHAQQSEGLSTQAGWREWLETHLTALENTSSTFKSLHGTALNELVDRIKRALEKKELHSTDFEPLHKDVVAFFTSANDDRPMVHGLSNLALLSFDDNAALNNSVFSVKRLIIIKKDRQGEYIPLCTKNVFLKYYSQDEDSVQQYFWGPADRKMYVKAMNDVLSGYISKEIDYDFV